MIIAENETITKNCIYTNTTEELVPKCSGLICMAWKWTDVINRLGCCGMVYPSLGVKNDHKN